MTSIATYLLKNWKTGATGVAAILLAAADYASHGTLSQADIMGVLAGFGLVAAQDAKPAAVNG